MEIDHRRLLLDLVQMAEGPARHGVWQQAKVSAAGHRQPPAATSNRRGGKLPDRAPGADRAPMREAGGVRNPVPVVDDREDARIVAEYCLGQSLETPQGAANDGKSRSPISDHRDTGRLFHRGLPSPDVLGKVAPAEPRDHLVGVTVAGHLVTAGPNGLDEPQGPPRPPAPN